MVKKQSLGSGKKLKEKKKNKKEEDQKRKTHENTLNAFMECLKLCLSKSSVEDLGLGLVFEIKF